MRRREFLIGGTASALLAAPPMAFSQPADEIVALGTLPPLPKDLVAHANEPPAPYQEMGLVGSGAPSTEEIDTAYQILVESPFGIAPVDIAQYFLTVGTGAYGEDWRPFAREWPVRANPMIFHFFSATMTKPEGDKTAWCAAFMNWCILRSHATISEEIGASPGFFSKAGKPFEIEKVKRHSTSSASSGSFRCWDESTSVKRGDIAVFANPGTDDLGRVCRGQGHVAFFLSTPRQNRIRVLGGNQTSPGSGGAITIAEMKSGMGSRFLKYVTLR